MLEELSAGSADLFLGVLDGEFDAEGRRPVGGRTDDGDGETRRVKSTLN